MLEGSEETDGRGVGVVEQQVQGPWYHYLGI